MPNEDVPAGCLPISLSICNAGLGYWPFGAIWEFLGAMLVSCLLAGRLGLHVCDRAHRRTYSTLSAFDSLDSTDSTRSVFDSFECQTN